MNQKTVRNPVKAEFVLLMASLTSTIALAIDMMLPALGIIGEDLGVSNTNETQLIISFLFIGFSIGQFIHGPASDTYGRKRMIYLGFIVAIFGTLLCFIATSMELMLAGRLLQGLGAAAGRTIVIAIVRDKYSGKNMAQVSSIVMTVFIVVPAMAPAIGQLILEFAHWRYIFALFLTFVLCNLIWFNLRQPETLPKEARTPFSFASLIKAATEVCTNRYSFGYTILSGLAFGGFLGYLSSSRQIFQDLYQVGDHFVYYFSALALCIGAASLINSRLVMRIGIKTITFTSLALSTIVCLIFFIISFYQNFFLPLPVFMTFCIIHFAFIGMTFGNISALAMQPMKHIAGMASAITGGLAGLISIAFGTLVGQLYDSTLFALLVGFLCASIAAVIFMFIIEKRKVLG